MKIKPTGRGFEVAATIPRVVGVPTIAPALDDSGEAPLVYESVSGALYVFDPVSKAWVLAGSGGGGSGTVTSVAATAGGLLAVAGTPTVAPTVGMAATAANTLIGNATSGSAVPTALSVTQVQSLLGRTSMLEMINSSAASFLAPGFGTYFDDYISATGSTVYHFSGALSQGQSLRSSPYGSSGWIRLDSSPSLGQGAAQAYPSGLGLNSLASNLTNFLVNNAQTDPWYIEGRVEFVTNLATGWLTACALVAPYNGTASIAVGNASGFDQVFWVGLGMDGANSTSFLTVTIWNNSSFHRQTTTIPYSASAHSYGLGSDGAGTMYATLDGVRAWSTTDLTGIQAAPHQVSQWVVGPDAGTYHMNCDYYYGAGNRH